VSKEYLDFLQKLEIEYKENYLFDWFDKHVYPEKEDCGIMKKDHINIEVFLPYWISYLI
jgi:hypothetical protein